MQNSKLTRYTITSRRSSHHLHQLARTLVNEVVDDLDPQWGGGQMSAAAYDTAWVAMVRAPQQPPTLAFPRSFEWLLANQSSDGSWSGPAPYSLLPTLAGLLALLKAPPSYQTHQTRFAADLAHTYLREALRHWSVKNHESVGFEVLAPGLLAQLEDLGLTFDFSDKAVLLKLYEAKLRIAAPELIYSGQSNLIHSLEGFGPNLEYPRLKAQQAANGSYGCSPAATAAVLIYGKEWDAKAAAWLTHLSEGAFQGNGARQPGAMPNAYSIDAFELSWVLYNLAEGGFDIEHSFPTVQVQTLLNWLYASLTPNGGSISLLGGMPADADDTGVIIAALNLAQPSRRTTSANCLRHFERATHFACFELERGASLSANAHVLAALLSVPEPQQVRHAASISKLVDFLYSVREANDVWEDKWHLSTYYATACAVLALAAHPHKAVRSKLRSTVEWVLQTQSSRDGGWGKGGSFSTPEETAYALQILKATGNEVLPTSAYSHRQQAIKRGQDYLWQYLLNQFAVNESEGLEMDAVARLWRGKELYAPKRVVLSAILAALA